MIEIAVFLGILLVLAVLFSKIRFDKAWIFLCSALLSAYATFGLLPYSIQKSLSFLPENGRMWHSLIVLPGVFIVLFFVIRIIFSCLCPRETKEIAYPSSRMLFMLTGVCLFAGFVVWGGIIALGIVPFLNIKKIQPDISNKCLSFAQRVVPVTLQTVQCGTPPNEHQKVWYTLYPTLSYVFDDTVKKKEEKPRIISSKPHRSLLLPNDEVEALEEALEGYSVK